MQYSTREAFGIMISQRGIHNQLGLPKNAIAQFRRCYKQGKGITLDKMEELLSKAGWSVIQEKIWEKKP